MNQEERAAISRRNGSQSHGPVTDSGKSRSARNAIRSGKYAQLLKDFVPPHAAVLCNQDRQAYYRAAEKFIRKYNPVDDAESHIVGRLVEAEWRIELINRITAGIWNREIVRQFENYSAHLPEVRELLALLDATEKLADRTRLLSFARQFIREQDRIVLHCERRLLQLRRAFPSEGMATNRTAFRERRLPAASAGNEPGSNRELTPNQPAGPGSPASLPDPGEDRA